MLGHWGGEGRAGRSGGGEGLRWGGVGQGVLREGPSRDRGQRSVSFALNRATGKHHAIHACFSGDPMVILSGKGSAVTLSCLFSQAALLWPGFHMVPSPVTSQNNLLCPPPPRHPQPYHFTHARPSSVFSGQCWGYRGPVGQPDLHLLLTSSVLLSFGCQDPCTQPAFAGFPCSLFGVAGPAWETADWSP